MLDFLRAELSRKSNLGQFACSISFRVAQTFELHQMEQVINLQSDVKRAHILPAAGLGDLYSALALSQV